MSFFAEDSALHRLLNHKNAIVGLAVLCAVLVTATGYRAMKDYSEPSSAFDWENRGLSDFHYGSYYPALAFRNAVNPYSPDVMEKYPVSSPSRPCPPITFMLHLPFSFLELHTADVVFFVYNTALLFLLAYLCVKFIRGQFHPGWWLLFSSLLLVSRPGHITLFTGYYTLELVIGTWIALHFARTRPWVSAVGILVASSKPTFVIPLLLLMAARKNFRATVYGVLLCGLAGIGGLAWLAQDGGFTGVIQGIVAGQEAFHADETEFPVNTWTRVDMLGMYAKVVDWRPDDSVYLFGMFGLIAIPCIAVWQITDREDAPQLSGVTSLIVLLTMLVGLYHHSYDCLLVALPWLGVTFFPNRVLPEFGSRIKMYLAILLSVPMFNYASTQSARGLLGLDPTGALWQFITLVNGLCLTAALLITLAGAWRMAVAHTIQKDFGR